MKEPALGGWVIERVFSFRAHPTHSWVAHAADLSLELAIDRERSVKVIALFYGRPPTAFTQLRLL